MRWAKTVSIEVYGLFVDDLGFAAAIMAWVLLVWLASAHLGLASLWSAVALFAGLAVIFTESAMRRRRP